MNILILSQFFSTTKGGGEYVFSTLTKSLAKHNHRIWVITNKIKNESYEGIENVPKKFKGKGKGIRSAQPGKWKEGFTDNEKELMNMIMGEYLKTLGY